MNARQTRKTETVTKKPVSRTTRSPKVSRVPPEEPIIAESVPKKSVRSQKTSARSPRTKTVKSKIIDSREEYLISMLKNALYDQDVSNDDIEAISSVLLSLKYKGTDDYIIDINRKDIIMEIVPMLRTTDLDKVVKFLQKANDPDYILWNQKSVEQGKVKYSRQIAMLYEQKEGIELDNNSCRFCSSKKLVFRLAQTAGGDEGTRIFTTCVACDNLQ